MSTKTVVTEQGIVVRRIGPSGESAIRWSFDGTWACSLDHKDRWHFIDRSEVPGEVLDAIADYVEKCRDDERIAALLQGAA